MCGFNFSYFLSGLQLVPTAPYRILELGGSEIAAGMFLGFGTYAMAVSAPITGSLAARFGRRRMLIVCSLALSALVAAFAVGLLWIKLFPELWRVQSVVPEEDEKHSERSASA